MTGDIFILPLICKCFYRRPRMKGPSILIYQIIF